MRTVSHWEGECNATTTLTTSNTVDISHNSPQSPIPSHKLAQPHPAVPLAEPVGLIRRDPWYASLGIRLFRDVVPLGTFTPPELFEYLGLDPARFGRLLGGQETDSSCVMLDKRVCSCSYLVVRC